MTVFFADICLWCWQSTIDIYICAKYLPANYSVIRSDMPNTEGFKSINIALFCCGVFTFDTYKLKVFRCISISRPGFVSHSLTQDWLPGGLETYHTYLKAKTNLKYIFGKSQENLGKISKKSQIYILERSWKNLKQISEKSGANLEQILGISQTNLRQIMGKSLANLRHILG